MSRKETLWLIVIAIGLFCLFGFIAMKVTDYLSTLGYKE